MGIASGLVLFAVVWCVIFFLLNPLWQTSQAEDGHVVPGTPASAPAEQKLRKKVWISTWVSAVLVGVIWVVLSTEILSLDDLAYILPPSER
ncbi:MAG: DUF1467 family protein [Pseudomonadota bacterium]